MRKWRVEGSFNRLYLFARLNGVLEIMFCYCCCCKWRMSRTVAHLRWTGMNSCWWIIIMITHATYSLTEALIIINENFHTCPQQKPPEVENCSLWLCSIGSSNQQQAFKMTEEGACIRKPFQMWKFILSFTWKTNGKNYSNQIQLWWLPLWIYRFWSSSH